jgi:hypothetical protein
MDKSAAAQWWVKNIRTIVGGHDSTYSEEADSSGWVHTEEAAVVTHERCSHLLAITTTATTWVAFF